MAASAAGLADRFLQFSLLGLIASGCLALAGSGSLDAPSAALTFAGLLLRLLQLAGVVRLDIPAMVAGAAALTYAGFFFVDWAVISRDFLRATIHLACFLAVVKVHTAKTSRDFVQVKIIALLLLVAAAILSVSLNFFGFLVLFLVFGVATFNGTEIRRAAAREGRVARGWHHRFSYRLAWMSLGITAGILSITAGLFFLLPRTAHAAFRRLVEPRIHVPGFSNEVRLGEIGRVLHQNTPVMHVRFHGKQDVLPARWRGAALEQFDGKRWFKPSGPERLLQVERRQLLLAGDEQRRRPGRRAFYEVDLKGIASDTLFFAGVPEFLVIDAAAVFRDSSGCYRLGFPPAEGLRYICYSYLGDLLQFAPAPGAGLLQLPPLDARIADLARRLTSGLESGESKARAIERHLRTSYAYTTELPERETSDPLAHFLFERKKGHCEYYASAMAVMLRSIGIPSRVVTGFHGGELNPVSGWYVVRASDAHSWVEAHLPESGWMSFDPTPPGEPRRRASLWAKVNHYIDAAEMFWHEWVVDYDRERQLQLAMTMESSSRGLGVRWLDRAGIFLQETRAIVTEGVRNYGGTALIGGAGLAAGWFLGPLAWRWIRARVRVQRARRGQAQAADATLLYRRMLEVLERRGYEKPSWFTPGEFALQIQNEETAKLVAELTGAYHELRYGGRREAAPRMTALLARLEQLP